MTAQLAAPERMFGYDVDIPGGDHGALERLVLKALREGVRLTPTDRPGEFLATRPGSSGIYVVTVDRCTCRAGLLGKPCKHRAVVLLISAIIDTGGKYVTHLTPCTPRDRVTGPTALHRSYPSIPDQKRGTTMTDPDIRMTPRDLVEMRAATSRPLGSLADADRELQALADQHAALERAQRLVASLQGLDFDVAQGIQERQSDPYGLAAGPAS